MPLSKVSANLPEIGDFPTEILIEFVMSIFRIKQLTILPNSRHYCVRLGLAHVRPLMFETIRIPNREHEEEDGF